MFLWFAFDPKKITKKKTNYSFGFRMEMVKKSEVPIQGNSLLPVVCTPVVGTSPTGAHLKGFGWWVGKGSWCMWTCWGMLIKHLEGGGTPPSHCSHTGTKFTVSGGWSLSHNEECFGWLKGGERGKMKKKCIQNEEKLMEGFLSFPEEEPRGK